MKPPSARQTVRAAVLTILAQAPLAVLAADGSLDEVVVTAQRRAESLQDVPLSVTALSADTLAANGVLDLSRLEVLTPGLSLGQQGASAQTAIRGARTEAVLVNVQPIIGFYSDGVYRSGSEQALVPLVDMQRVEVLRGPQGTLFGKNTYGGAINYISKKPDASAFDFGLSTTTGEYNRFDGDGYVNMPLSENVAVRISAAHFGHSGYVENTFKSSDDLGNRNENFVRAQMKVDFNPDASLLLRYEYWRQLGNGEGDFTYFSPGTPRQPGPSGTATLADPTSVFGVVVPIKTLGGSALSPADTDPYRIARDDQFILDARQNTYSGELNWGLGFADLTALVAHTTYFNYHTNDPDFSQYPGTRSAQYDFTQMWQEELRLTSKQEGRVRWLAGTYFSQERAGDSYYFSTLHLSTTGADLDDNPIVTTDADTANKVPDPTAGPGYYFANRRNVSTDTLAFYGDGSISFLDDRMHIGGGVRWSQDREHFRVIQLFNPPDFLDVAAPDDFRNTDFTPNANGSIAELANLGRNFSAVTWRASIDFKLQPKNLIYATVSTGFASGGFNSAPDPLTGQFTYGPQHVTAYEVGSKNSLLDGAMTLNLSAYYNDYKQMLAEPAVNIQGVTIVFDGIGGKAHAQGLEASLDWAVTRELRLSGSAAYLDAKYGKGFLTGTGSGLTIGNTTRVDTSGNTVPYVDLSGDTIEFSPKYTFGLSADYTIALGTLGSLIPGVTEYYSDKFRTSDQPYSFAWQPAYNKTDLRLDWRSAGGHFSGGLFVQNLENKAVLARTTIYQASLIGQQYSDPRIWGARLSYYFR